MKTIEINLYSFSELSEKAKQRAKDQFSYDDFWGADRENSYIAAKKLYKLFDIDAELTGVRLYIFIQNNILPKLRNYIKYTKGNKCASSKIFKNEKARFSKIQYTEDAGNLTGYCNDYDFLEPLFSFIENPNNKTTNYDLLNTDLDSINDQCYRQDYEFFYEDENFSEHCDANEYTFEDNGTMRNY